MCYCSRASLPLSPTSESQSLRASGLGLGVECLEFKDLRFTLFRSLTCNGIRVFTLTGGKSGLRESTI